MEENNVTIVDQKLDPIKVEVTSVDSQGNYEKHTDTIMTPIASGLQQYTTGIEEKLAEVRKENETANPVAHIDTSEQSNKVSYLKAFHSYLHSLGYKEISELLKISSHLNDENYNLYKNLPVMTKDYIDAEAKKDNINTKDEKVFKQYIKIKVEDIISQLELDDAFEKFKKDLNDAFEGKDCFEDLFNEDKIRIIDYYEKIAASYEKTADSIDNPSAANTYNEKIEDNKCIDISNETPDLQITDNTTGEYNNTTTLPETEMPNNLKLSFINDSKSYREQAKKLLDCRDGYIDALNFDLLVEFIKNNQIHAQRLTDGAKYIKRGDRYITEFESYIKRSRLECTEPIKQSLTKLAQTFKVNYDAVLRVFIIMVLRLREMEDGPKKLHYGYYSFQVMKRFYRMDSEKIQTEYVKNIYNKFANALTQAADICNKCLEV